MSEQVKEEASQCLQERVGELRGDILKYGNLIQQDRERDSAVLQGIYRLLQENSVRLLELQGTCPLIYAIFPIPAEPCYANRSLPG